MKKIEDAIGGDGRKTPGLKKRPIELKNQGGPILGRGLLFLTISVLVANPKKLLYTVVNPARDLLNREEITKEKVWQHTPPPPHPQHCSFGEK